MNPYAIIGALVAAILIGVGGFHLGNTYGTNAEKAKDQGAEIARKDETIVTLTKANKDNQELAKKQADDAKQENKNHEKELADVRARAIADAGKRVPIDRAKFCSGHSAGPAETSAPGSDGQATEAAAFLPEPLTGNLRQLAAEADEVNADLRSMIQRADKAGCFQ
jgi:hypothetical protein